MTIQPAVPNSAAIDTHVHVFRRGEGLVAERRYTPDYDALPGELILRLEENGLGRAILVQPSFLGTDNRFLLRAIAAQSGRFSGIAVVPPEITRNDLMALRDAGVLGVRFNCIGRAVPDFSGDHRSLVEHLAALDMVLQIQAEGAQWRVLEAFLSEAQVRVVIDHFGRAPVGDASGGFEVLLRAARQSQRLWFKMSAPYRMAGGAANHCAEAIIETVGLSRIIWGSDWPATQFEGQHSYADTLAWLSRWVPIEDDRRRILVENPRVLFRRAL